MKMRVFSLLLAAMLLPIGAIAAQKADLPTAEELLALYPTPEAAVSIETLDDPLLRLINKSHKMEPWDYEPDDLRMPEVNAKNKNVLLRDVAAAALENLFADAQEAGHTLTAVSGYRSYGTQKSIYRNAVEKKGERQASLANAKAGQSEHQLGLAMDVSCPAIKNNLNKKFSETAEGQWVAAHCAEYGFIIRYKTEWVDVTKYKGEPWHLRYVGAEHAKAIERLNVPFEIYLDYLRLALGGQTAQP